MTLELVAPFLQEKLQKAPFEITQLFPVQIECLKYFRNGAADGKTDFDLLVSAATGSGKTLAFALPIVSSLINRIVCRVRAVVVLPTRDLALQVKRTFDDLCAGEKLKVGLAVGASSFAVEQSNLMIDHFAGLDGDDESGTRWSSKVDILVATPGRLVDHITSTPGFTLNHLEFLVIDEADRLMNQNYQGWLDVVYNHINPYTTLYPSVIHRPNFAPSIQKRCRKMLFSATLTRNPEKLDSLKLQNPIFVTVSQIDELMIKSDPKSLAHEENSDPIIKPSDLTQTSLGSHQFTIPSTLKEEYWALEAHQKPLALLYLLLTKQLDGVVVFVKSVQSANRLASLLQQATKNTISISALSSDQSPSFRKTILEEFLNAKKPHSDDNQETKRKNQVLICTDLIARGIDLAQSVSTIVNYDIPSNLTTYIHRIGRTSRAGRQGKALSLIEKSQMKWWRKRICYSSEVYRNESVLQISIEKEELQVYENEYQSGLEHLQKVYGRSQEGAGSKKRKADLVDDSSSSTSSDSSSSSSSDSLSSSSSDSSSSSSESSSSEESSSEDNPSEKSTQDRFSKSNSLNSGSKSPINTTTPNEKKLSWSCKNWKDSDWVSL